MDGSSLILNISYAILVSATLFRDLFWLRMMLILGAVGFVTYGLAIDNHTIAGWNSVTGSMHSVQLFRYVQARRSVHLTDEDESFRLALCPETDRYDFYLLWSIGEEVVKENENFTVQGEVQHTMALVLEGIVEVSIDGEVVAKRERGTLVGELSYLSGDPASATAHALGTVRAREWNQMELNALEAVNPASARALHKIISRSIASRG